MNLSENIKEIDMSPIRKVFDLAKELENPVNLSIGLPHFNAEDTLKIKLCHAVNQEHNRYTPTQGLAELRKQVQQKLLVENNISCDMENIMITSGVAGGFDLALRCLLNPGEEVIIPDPYFVAYTALCTMCHAKPVLLNTYPDFTIKKDMLEKSVSSKTKAIVINTPNNPTGKVYSEQELKAIADIAKKNNLLVISDEIYEPFVYEGEHYSIGSIYDKVLTLNGFSKSHGVTGWRLGYAAGPKELIAEMCKLQQFTYVCAPAPVQYAFLGEQLLPELQSKNIYKQNIELIKEELKKHYDFLIPEGAFYAFLKVPKGYENASEFATRAIKHNLLVVPGKAFSEQDDYFRISFATTPDIIRQGIEILKTMAGNS